MRRPLFADQHRAVAVGLVLVAAGFVVLYDAYDGRGERKPRLLGPFLPW
jgi:hypothetical protein